MAISVRRPDLLVILRVLTTLSAMRLSTHRFIEQGKYEDQLAEAGLNAMQIAATALTTMGKPKDSLLTLSASGSNGSKKM